jgi:hypothetical protein
MRDRGSEKFEPTPLLKKIASIAEVEGAKISFNIYWPA